MNRATNEAHADVGVRHESEWSLSVFRGGYQVLENVEEPEARPVHMRRVAREETFEFLRLVTAGQMEEVRRRGWLQGTAS